MDISEIVNVTIEVQSSALTRQGFNSLMLLGVAADFAVGFTEFEVRVYSTYQSVVDDTDIVDGDLKDAILVAFGQSPAVPQVYVSRVDAIDGALAASELDSIAANNNAWFGFAMPGRADADDATTASAWIAANKKYGFFQITTVATDLGLNSNFSSVWYTDSTYTGPAQWLAVALASRILSKIPGSYTAAFKTLEIVSTVDLSGTDEQTLKDNSVNYYTPVAGRPITWEGVTSSEAKGFIDIYIGVLYLEARLQEDVFGLMASLDKVPYTNDGVTLITNVVEARLQQSVIETFLTSDPAYVVTAPLVSDISAVDKGNRLLPNISFVAYAAGAIHTVQINGTIVI
jgi:hypothetical protein